MNYFFFLLKAFIRLIENIKKIIIINILYSSKNLYIKYSCGEKNLYNPLNLVKRYILDMSNT